MIGGNLRWISSVSMVGLLFVLRSPPAHATVYSWRGEGGVLMLSNDPEDVPEDHRASAQTFTAKPAPRQPEGVDTPLPSSVEAAQLDAYERGFERGLQMGERQVALAESLARTVLAAVPPTPPAPVIVELPAPPSAPYAAPPYYPTPFYGIGPYTPWPFGYTFAFGGRVVPHSHFFPGTRGRRSGLFFTHGRMWRSGMRAVRTR
jgi:hypothetical protein